ncbi:MAG TPA: hypothetical protein VGS05_04835 [Candidatus Sulfotelmatobacter sp.]|nr:hypothetical protein [Candidatus Sulfotelmatobacter sp.]
MNLSRLFSAGLLGLAVWIYSANAWGQQEPPTAGVPVHMVVTVEPNHGKEVPTINQGDVIVTEGHDKDTVTDWIPAQGDRAALELFIMIDDSSSSSLGRQLDDLKHFIEGQPASAKIGIAYMQNGIANVVQNLTADHAQAEKALRLPMGIGGANASPYFSLSDLIKRWPADHARHEVMMVTDGIDFYYGIGDLQDPYLDAAISDSIRAGVTVSAIYNPGVGHLGHDYWLTYWGQNYLAELTDQTGGEGYYLGMTGSPVAFQPYLDDFAQRLQHQYWLGFLAKPQKKAGFQNVKVSTEVKNVQLVGARKVYVQAPQ